MFRAAKPIGSDEVSVPEEQRPVGVPDASAPIPENPKIPDLKGDHAELHKRSLAYAESLKKDPWPPQEIESLAATVDPDKLAEEVLQWLCGGVEQYVENQQTLYRVYITVDAPDDMPNAYKVQELYSRIPESDPVVEERLLDLLDAKVAEAKRIIPSKAELMQTWFRKLAFYYEMTGLSVETGPVIQEMDGEIRLLEFLFEPVPMMIQIKQRVGEAAKDGEVKTINAAAAESDSGFGVKKVDGAQSGEAKVEVVETDRSEIIREVPLPIGYGVEFEIDMWPRQPQVSIY